VYEALSYLCMRPSATSSLRQCDTGVLLLPADLAHLVGGHKIQILDCRNASDVQVLTLLALLVQKYTYWRAYDPDARLPAMRLRFRLLALLDLLVQKNAQCTRFISTKVHKTQILDCRNASEGQVLTHLTRFTSTKIQILTCGAARQAGRLKGSLVLNSTNSTSSRASVAAIAPAEMREMLARVLSLLALLVQEYKY
jgi:hypothetical protein